MQCEIALCPRKLAEGVKGGMCPYHWGRWMEYVYWRRFFELPLAGKRFKDRMELEEHHRNRTQNPAEA